MTFCCSFCKIIKLWSLISLIRKMKSMKPPPKFAFCCSDGFDLTEKRSPYPAGGMIWKHNANVFLRSFLKTLSKQEETGARFSFWRGLKYFWKPWHYNNYNQMIVAILNLTYLGWTENACCFFRVKSPFSNSSNVGDSFVTSIITVACALHCKRVVQIRLKMLIVGT